MQSQEDIFGGVAREYARRRPPWPSALFEWLVEVAPQAACAWDVGTGNGQAALGLARFFDRVIGTDVSAPQIEHAILHPRIDYRVGRAEESGIVAGSVDCVLAAQSAHWLDLPAFWREARRVARPGAPVVLACYQLCRLPEGLDEAFGTFHEAAIRPWWPEERGMVDAGYGGIPMPFEEIAAPQLTISETWTLDRLLGYVATWSSVRRAYLTTGVDLTAELLQALGGSSSGWPERRIVVTWPVALRAGRVV